MMSSVKNGPSRLAGGRGGVLVEAELGHAVHRSSCSASSAAASFSSSAPRSMFAVKRGAEPRCSGERLLSSPMRISASSSRMPPLMPQPRELNLEL